MQPTLIRRIVVLLGTILLLSASIRPQSAESTDLSPLIGLLGELEDASVQNDILKGILAGLQGVPRHPMPATWPAIEERLLTSESPTVRESALLLGLKFDRPNARQMLETTIENPSAPASFRNQALQALIATPNDSLVALLLKLLKDPDLRGQAIRGLATRPDARIPGRLLDLYGQLGRLEKQDVLHALSTRPAFAKSLLDGVSRGQVPRNDLTASTLQQLKNLKDTEIDKLIERVWGTFGAPSGDATAMIRHYRKILRDAGSPYGDATRGRSQFIQRCQQCHKLYGFGGEIGPDLTGSNRNDQTYLLQNILDPNSVIPKDYQTSIIETQDDRVITGIITEQTPTQTTLVTPNETLHLPTDQILDIQSSSLSLMPEGLLTGLSDQAIRDLVFYLAQPRQAPLEATPNNLDLFFNGNDLTGWDGDSALWLVKDGSIIGHAPEGLAHNEFLVSQVILGDFRFVFEIKLTPNSENSGIQFRSQPQPDGEVKGYQADAGEGWWGKLYEELGRGLLASDDRDSFVRKNEWNRYEILATGHRIQTAINGNPCVDITDPNGDLTGRVAFQLHSGGPLTVAIRDLELELSPESNVLKTVNN